MRAECHAPLRPPQRDDRGRAQGRARAQARLRRGREPAGLAQGAGEFRHRRRPPRRGDAQGRIADRPGPATASSARKAASIDRHRHRPTPGSSIRSTAPPISCTAFRNSRSRSGSSATARSSRASCYNPITDEMFIAERGKGAFLNDQRMRVAARKRLADAVIACGLPHLGRGDLELGLQGTRRGPGQGRGAAAFRRGRARPRLRRGRPPRRLLGAQMSPWDIAAGII